MEIFIDINFILDIFIRAVIPILVSGMVGALVLMWKRVRALQLGLTSLMRDRLSQSCRHWISEEYCPLEEREVLEKLFEAYHINGGNGVMEDLYIRTMNLPYELTKNN